MYLWEDDINNNFETCKSLVELYTIKGGKLDNYNSFNYSLVENKLMLNTKIVKPYQEQNLNEYKKLEIK